MKTYPRFLLTFGALSGVMLASVLPLAAQPTPPPPIPDSVKPVDPLAQLVAPIALYPDALVALILPASTASTDIVLAARYLDAGGDPNDVGSRAWDDSVKGLVHYPEVIKWMSENLEWTEQLGAAYLSQPDAVMAAIQHDRALARANGTLVDTPQQQVIVEDGYISIVPAQPNVIYVPAYDPEIIYLAQPPDFYPGPLITFGVGFGVGYWLSYDCDWAGRRIWVDRHSREHWREHEHHDWRHHEWPHHPGSVAGGNWHQWRPAPNRPRPPHRETDWAHHPVHRPVPPSRAVQVRHDEHGRPVFVRPQPTRPPEVRGRTAEHRDPRQPVGQRRDNPRANWPRLHRDGGQPPQSQAPSQPWPAPGAYSTPPPASEPRPAQQPPPSHQSGRQQHHEPNGGQPVYTPRPAPPPPVPTHRAEPPPRYEPRPAPPMPTQRAEPQTGPAPQRVQPAPPPMPTHRSEPQTGPAPQRMQSAPAPAPAPAPRAESHEAPRSEGSRESRQQHDR